MFAIYLSCRLQMTRHFILLCGVIISERPYNDFSVGYALYSEPANGQSFICRENVPAQKEVLK